MAVQGDQVTGHRFARSETDRDRLTGRHTVDGAALGRHGDEYAGQRRLEA